MKLLEYLDKDNVDISKFVYENRDQIPIIATVKVTTELWGRLDKIVNKYYQGQMEYYKLLLDFNRIQNPIDVKIGQMIDVPDFETYITNLSELELFDTDRVAGVNPSMNSLIVNSNNKNATGNKNSKETVGIPKLKIKLRKVAYDKASGIITY